MSNSANTSPTDQNIQISDVTTNNTSTTKHGFTPKYPNDATKYLDGTGAYTVPAGGGTVTTVSVATANGFSGTVANPTTTPAITIIAGAITPNTVAASDATTPSISTISGSTNTGYMQISGKTSGALKITAADATAQTVTLTTAAQTVGAATLTIPNMANVNKTVAWLESPSFTTPALGVATATSINGNTLTTGTGTITITGTKTLTVADTASVSGTNTGDNSSSNLLALNSGGTAANLTASNGGIFYSTASAGAILSGTATASKMLLSGASTTPTWSTSTIPTSAGATANKLLLSDGTNYVLSTPTFPNASATSGKFIRSDGTNWIASTPTLPTSAGTSGKHLMSDGTNYIETTPTYPNSATTSKILVGDGTNIVLSTPTFPNASATSGKIIKSDGTNWTASTETYAAPGTSGNVLTSDGTNWTSAAAGGGAVMTKLTSGSGSSSTTSANNLATIAISGMTIVDHLYIKITLDAQTQVGGTVTLYSSTDSANIQELMAGGSSLQAGCDYSGFATMMQNPRTANTYLTNVLEVQAAWSTGTGQTGGSVRYASAPLTTAWTSSWTLALRSGGVTSGGTLKWAWSVYKVTG